MSVKNDNKIKMYKGTALIHAAKSMDKIFIFLYKNKLLNIKSDGHHHNCNNIIFNNNNKKLLFIKNNITFLNTVSLYIY